MEHFYNSAPQADEAWYIGTDTMIPGIVQSASPTAVPSGRQGQSSLSATQADRQEQVKPSAAMPENGQERDSLFALQVGRQQDTAASHLGAIKKEPAPETALRGDRQSTICGGPGLRVYLRAYTGQKVPGLHKFARGVRGCHDNAPSVLREKSRAGPFSDPPWKPRDLLPPECGGADEG